MTTNDNSLTLKSNSIFTMSKSISLLVGIVLLFVVGIETSAQLADIVPLSSFRIGGAIGMNLNSTSANFTQLSSDYPNCCPNFTGGSGSGLSFVGFYEMSVGGSLRLSMRLNYANRSSEMVEIETIGDARFNDQIVSGTSEHKLSTSLATVGLEPLLGYRVTDVFTLHAGLRADMLMTKTFTQIETLLTPNGGTFESLKRTRNEFTDKEIPNASGMLLAGIIGASYELPLSSLKTFLLVPEVFYSLGLSEIAPNTGWKTGGLTFNLALKWAPLPEESSPLTPQKDR